MATSQPSLDLQLYYKGSGSQPANNGIVRKAFDEAVVYICTELTEDEVKRRWIGQRTSINDALAVVLDAQKKYATSKSKRGSFHRCVAKLPERLMYYSCVIDVLAQAYPEYSALAWGAIKFILMGLIEHTKLFSEISEALILVGDALAQADFDAQVYPTSFMEAAISRLYVYIILFLQKAVKWYTMSSARRLINAVFEPYDIGYKSTVEKIRKCIANLKDTANNAAHAELRYVSKSQEYHQETLESMFEELREARQELKMIGSRMSSQEDVLNKMLHYVSGSHAMDNRLLLYAEDGRMAAILDELGSGFDAMARYQACLVVSRKRKAWTQAADESTLALRAIRRWVSSSRSSFLVVQGSPREEAKIKDLVVDVVHWAQSVGAPIVWTLSSNNKEEDMQLSSLGGIWKVLTSQVLQQNSAVLNNLTADLSVTELKTQRAAIDWKALFCAAVMQIQKCILVVEARDLFELIADDPSEVTAFLLEFQKIVDAVTNHGSTIKVLVASYCASRVAITNLPEHADRSTIFVRRSVKSRQKSRPNAGKRKTGLRNLRAF